ncbi:MAG: PLP-dependent aminotransferase family protein, partial [Gammaproteobacteria bacterium]|nr:PLP-dependent aminotransferase family protein [Gammaproteobacteria bacterium]
MNEQNLYARRMASIQPSFIREILKAAEDPKVISFAGGLPNADYFPAQAMGEISSRLFTSRSVDILQYGQTEGELELREYISRLYRQRHQLDVPADNILITNGSQQAFDLIGKVLIDEGDGVVIESPGYLGAIQSLMIYQPRFLPVALEQNGMQLAEFEAAMAARPKLVYSVPNFQNPTGYSYDTETREGMARLIQQQHCLIVEDDPYGEIRFGGEPEPSFYRYLPEQTLLLG